MTDVVPGRGGTRQPKPFRIGPGENAPLQLLTPALVRWLRHYTDDRPVVCPQILGLHCVTCEGGGQQRRSYWAQVRHQRSRQIMPAELSSGAFDHCPELREVAHDCRGWVLSISRLAGRCGGQKVQMLHREAEPHQCPRATLNVWPYLLWLFNVPKELLDQATPAARAGAFAICTVANVPNARMKGTSSQYAPKSLSNVEEIPLP